MNEPLMEVLAADATGAAGGWIGAGCLAGVAAWAAALGGGAADALVLTAGVVPQPVGAVTVEAAAPLVLAALPQLAVAVIADPVRGEARWRAGRAAVQAVVDRVTLPVGAGAIVERAVARAPAVGGQSPEPVFRALDLAVTDQRRALALRLHDGPVQQLTAAQLLIDSALWDTQLPTGVRETLEQGLGALRGAIEACRAMMAELSAPSRGVRDA